MDLAHHQAWFSALAEPLGEAEQADIAAYLAGLGLPPDPAPRRVEGWEEAGRIMRSATGPWWDREEAERQRLERTVQLNPTDPQWIRLNELMHGAAAVAAARFGCADAALIKVAAGAACYAAYHFQLAEGAGAAPDHPFIRKFALFAGGRWPLGVYDGHYAIF
jgi:hypothetical protein